MDALSEHEEQFLGALSCLCAVLFLYALVRGTYYTHQSYAKLMVRAVLLSAQIANLFVNLKSNPRKAFNLTIWIIGIDSIAGLFLH